MLMKVARDKIFDRLLKRKKGKQSHPICDLNKCHNHAIELSIKSSVHMIDEDKWNVISQTDQDMFYTVLRKVIVHHARLALICTRAHV